MENLPAVPSAISDESLGMAYDGGITFESLLQATDHTADSLTEILSRTSAKWKRENLPKETNEAALADEMLQIITELARTASAGTALKAAMYVRDEIKGRLDKKPENSDEEKFELIQKRIHELFKGKELIHVIDTPTISQPSGDASDT